MPSVAVVSGTTLVGHLSVRHLRHVNVESMACLALPVVDFLVWLVVSFLLKRSFINNCCL